MSNNKEGIKLSEVQPNNNNNYTENEYDNTTNNSENPDDRTLNPHDSLTLGQLKKIIKQHQQSSKTSQNSNSEKGYSLDYELYLDLPVEINEFYSYTEVNRHLEAKNIFEECVEDWNNFDITQNLSQIEIWLETLETSDRSERFKASMCLLYLAQGQFNNKQSSQSHLEQLIFNNKKLRESNAVGYYYSGLKIACGNHDKLAQTYWTGSNIDINKMSEINLEIGLMLSLLYLYIEVNRNSSNDGFDLELANLDPSLPQFLFSLVAKLKEKSFKGYPIKKVLLLLWKVLLTINGDFKSLKELKKFNRIKSGLPPTKEYDNNNNNNSNISNSNKSGTPIKVNPEEYNFYYWEIMHKYPAPFSSLKSDPFLKASPTNTKWITNGPRPAMPNLTNLPNNMSLGSFYSNSIVQTPTPFIYPKNSKSDSKVPRPIREAIDLYDSNLEFSLGHLQIIKEEEANNNTNTSGSSNNNNNKRIDLEGMYNNYDRSQINKYEAQLDQIESLYKSILPDAHSIVVILLKLLLATIPNGKPNESNSSNNGSDLGQNLQLVETTPSNLSIEEVDDIRHKEIVAKSVSAILLLLLKQFKASHILKYEYWCTLLVDTNAILLILKMYGLQDFQNLVTVRNECDNMGFFRALIPNLQNDKTQLKSVSNPSDPNEILLGRGRNLFTAINFFRILNKLCKRKLSKLLLLIQFKSSAILKRGLKINHPLLNKYILKVIQYQVPYLGRKWRQSNMKIITLIYLNFNNKLGLREGWLLPSEIDQYADIQQDNFRKLIVGFHRREYGISVLNSLQSHPSINDLVQSPASGGNSHSNDHNNIHLDEEFMENYDVWLESEVFNNDGGGSETDELHLNDPEFWTVSTTEDEDELEEFEEDNSGEDLDSLNYIDPNLIDSGIKRPPSPPLLI